MAWVPLLSPPSSPSFPLYKWGNWSTERLHFLPVAPIPDPGAMGPTTTCLSPVRVRTARWIFAFWGALLKCSHLETHGKGPGFTSSHHFLGTVSGELLFPLMIDWLKNHDLVCYKRDPVHMAGEISCDWGECWSQASWITVHFLFVTLQK